MCGCDKVFKKMKLSFSGERVLAVMAHPDDAELLCAGTLARARKEGAQVGICVLCRGDKGAPSQAIRNLSAVRKREVMAAAKLLSAKVYFGDQPDGTLEDGPGNRRMLLDIYRRFQPTVILSHAPEDYHPDHKAASALAESASWFCASRGHKTKLAPLKAPPAVWFCDTLGMADFRSAFYIDVSDFLEVKAQMLACHKSQLQRGQDGDFSPLAELMTAQAGMRGLQSGVEAAEAFRALNSFKRGRAW
jgi:LmbE family N-acetylglucosaminyl deacetylase